jgi:aldehyde:ferredoxin oxidoreductase
MCQSSTFYQPWSQKYYGRQNDVPFYATKLCDDYGLDTWALELMILWMKRCYKAGILTDEKAGIPISQLGSLDFIQTLVRKISLREGLGDMLARGLDKAADFLGSEARREVRHTDPYDPRLYITTALLWATEPREPIQQLHEVGLPIAQWVNWVKKIEGAYLSSEVLRAIARRFWGSEIAADFSSYEGKALAAKQIQDREYAKECLILCDWLWPVMASEYSEGYVGDPSLESAILSAVTGDEVNEEGLYRIGEKVFNLQRAILIREGHRGREDDRIPEEWHTVPLKSNAVNADCVVPGKHGEVVCRKGAVVDRQAFERMKDEYYQLRGWDVATGFPSCAKLEELELDDVAQYLEQRGW